MAFWQPIASSVTIQPSSRRVSSSSGIAVISFDLPSTARWPSASPRPLAQALTRCSGPRSWRRLPERRTALPSTATTSRSIPSARDCAQRVKQASNASGSMSMNTRRKVSCEGMPFGRARKVPSQACLLRP